MYDITQFVESNKLVVCCSEKWCSTAGFWLKQHIVFHMGCTAGTQGTTLSVFEFCWTLTPRGVKWINYEWILLPHLTPRPLNYLTRLLMIYSFLWATLSQTRRWMKQGQMALRGKGTVNRHRQTTWKKRCSDAVSQMRLWYMAAQWLESNALLSKEAHYILVLANKVDLLWSSSQIQLHV